MSTRARTLAIVALVVYAALWVGWTHEWQWLRDVDSSTLAAAHRIGVEHHFSVTVWHLVGTVFSPLVLRVGVVCLVVYALVRGHRRVAAFLLLCVVLAGPLGEFAKWISDRPRPETAFAHAASTSFPSGHALGTMTFALAIGAVAWPHIRPSLRPLLVALGAAFVLVVGVSRVALNVHYPSDVIAGWALGYVWFVLWLPVLGLRNPRGAASVDAASPGLRLDTEVQ